MLACGIPCLSALHLNQWTAPSLTPSPSPAGVVPALRPAGPFAKPSPLEWLWGTHMGGPRLRARLLDSLPEVGKYGLGKGWVW